MKYLKILILSTFFYGCSALTLTTSNTPTNEFRSISNSNRLSNYIFNQRMNMNYRSRQSFNMFIYVRPFSAFNYNFYTNSYYFNNLDPYHPYAWLSNSIYSNPFIPNIYSYYNPYYRSFNRYRSRSYRRTNNTRSTRTTRNRVIRNRKPNSLPRIKNTQPTIIIPNPRPIIKPKPKPRKSYKSIPKVGKSN